MRRLMSFDGGGICGVLTATLLKRLDQLHPGLISRADGFAGTSTGGIIALCLASGVPIDAIIALYRDKGPVIFDQSTIRAIETVDGIFGSTYDPEGLYGVLDETLGSITMEQLKVDVLVPTFQLDNRHPDPRYRRWATRFWSRADVGVKVSDVARMTSAAPTFFPSYHVNVDGGVAQNNPCAAIACRYNGPDTYLLSLGTSQTMKYIDRDVEDYGELDWLRKGITEIFMQGPNDAATLMTQDLLGDRFRRINPGLQPGQDIPMDAVRDVPVLIDMGNGCDVLDVPEWLDRSGW